ncbi:shikimate dehydrogenase family protein [Undibacterium sp. RuRC25W]|uniref:shikimate dehydrogenase family protein n=1 Tax=Undibacterium sp. RuRC25W TaxID=3413047 RepID=UPI003BF4520F
MIEISGTTRIFFVIGWPVEQVKAPVLFNTYFKQHNIDARVIPLKVAPEAYTATVRTLMAIENVGGIFVSIPHKPMTVHSVDEVTPRAALASACNAVYKNADGQLIGDLIDGEGFVRALDRTCAIAPFDWINSRALVVGSGGVGCAIATALATRGIGEVALYDTRIEQAQSLRQRLQEAYREIKISIADPHAQGYDLIVNSTPLGMHAEDPLPLDLTGLSPNCIVADCGMKIEMTRLLTLAEQRGCRIQKGREMLIEQAPLYLELFGWPGVSSEQFRALGAL